MWLTGLNTPDDCLLSGPKYDIFVVVRLCSAVVRLFELQPDGAL